MKRSRAHSITRDKKTEILDRLPSVREIYWFRKKLQNWYNPNHRSFLWRESTDAYVICVAEIFLQQTTASKVVDIIEQFTKKFSSWDAIAAASIEEIETTIHPLGLFRRRAQTLHKLANALAKRRGLPRTRRGLESLPGIGQYIANVLLVVLQHKREPFLDVNMSRVLERFFGPREMADIRDDPYLQVLARKVVNVKDTLSANWAILDFAALVCTKRRPRCTNCPLLERCQEGRRDKAVVSHDSEAELLTKLDFNRVFLSTNN